MQLAMVAERDAFADDAVRPDVAALRDLGLRMNYGRWMNHGNLFLDRQFAIYAPVLKSQISNRKCFRRRAA
jgi:hypothetical protein